MGMGPRTQAEAKQKILDLKVEIERYKGYKDDWSKGHVKDLKIQIAQLKAKIPSLPK